MNKMVGRRKNLPAPPFEHGTPACSTPEIFSEWNELARFSTFEKDDMSAGFCTDCLPDYQQKMKAAGLCERPWIQFAMKRYAYKDLEHGTYVHKKAWYIAGVIPQGPGV